MGTPKFRCKDCHRQFVENPKHRLITDEEKSLINKLLLGRIFLAGIARVVGVSERWLQDYVNKLYCSIPQAIVVAAKPNLNLTIECDDLWSFVENKLHKQWVWLAIDRDTREILGVHIGNRSAEGA